MLLRMSLSGGILILMIAAVRFLTVNRLPKKYFMMLWGVALLRLLMPAELPFRFGVTTPVEKAVADKMNLVVLNRDFLQETAVRQASGQAGAEIWGDIAQALPWLWAVGTLALSAALIVLYLRECRRMNEAIPLETELARRLREEADIPGRARLLVSDRIVTPLVFGIVKPKIILPAFLTTDVSGRLKFVLAHEAVHVRRGDNLWKIVMMIAVCIHWFNPLVWIMYVLFTRDMELSCDEKVLSRFGEGAKREYARALVGLAEKQYRASLFAQGFGKSAIKERIEAIMKFKKATALSAACAVLLLGTAITVFAQNDQREISINDNDIAAVQRETGTVGDDIAEKEGPVEENAEENTAVDINSISSLVNSEEFSEYEKYGVSYDSETGDLMYNGEPVSFLYVMGETEGEIEMCISLPSDMEDESGETKGICVSKDAHGMITGITGIEGPSVTIEDGEVRTEMQFD